MSESEQNKTEDPTAFKLKRAREKGTVAKGTDLGFFSTLVALTCFALIAGPHLFGSLSEMMRGVLGTSIERASNPQETTAAIARIYQPAVQLVALLGGTVVIVVIFFEIIQLQGLNFSTHPLKPDFNRLNPAKGFKRLFSLRMVKETIKNVIKMAAYAGASYLVIRYSINLYGQSMTDGNRLRDALQGGGLRLLFLFVVLALIFAALDQIIARAEFFKEMKMSRSEVKREAKDREGDPRIKQKRKQLHAEFAKQGKALGNLPGSDMLIVNPQHFAVALAYDAKNMGAPTVTAKGRNLFALDLKRAAAIHAIPVFSQPKLARALYRSTETGKEISAKDFQSVADLYLRLYQNRPRPEGASNA